MSDGQPKNDRSDNDIDSVRHKNHESVTTGENQYTPPLSNLSEALQRAIGIIKPLTLASDQKIALEKFIAMLDYQQIKIMHGEYDALFEADPSYLLIDSDASNQETFLNEIKQYTDGMNRLNEKLQQEIAGFQALAQDNKAFLDFNSYYEKRLELARLELAHKSQAIEIDYNYLVEKQKIITDMLDNDDITDDIRASLEKQKALLDARINDFKPQIEYVKQIQNYCMSPNVPLTINQCQNFLADIKEISDALQQQVKQEQEQNKELFKISPALQEPLVNIDSELDNQHKANNNNFNGKKDFLVNEIEELSPCVSNVSNKITNAGFCIENILNQSKKSQNPVPQVEEAILRQLSNKLLNLFGPAIQGANSEEKIQQILIECSKDISDVINAVSSDNEHVSILVEALEQLNQNLQTAIHPMYLNLMADAPVTHNVPTLPVKPQKPIIDSSQTINADKQQQLKDRLLEIKQAQSAVMTPINEDIHEQIEELLAEIKEFNAILQAANPELSSSLTAQIETLQQSLTTEQVNQTALSYISETINKAIEQYPELEGLEELSITSNKIDTITEMIDEYSDDLGNVNGQSLQ